MLDASLRNSAGVKKRPELCSFSLAPSEASGEEGGQAEPAAQPEPLSCSFIARSPFTGAETIGPKQTVRAAGVPALGAQLPAAWLGAVKPPQTWGCVDS